MQELLSVPAALEVWVAVAERERVSSSVVEPVGDSVWDRAEGVGWWLSEKVSVGVAGDGEAVEIVRVPGLKDAVKVEQVGLREKEREAERVVLVGDTGLAVGVRVAEGLRDWLAEEVAVGVRRGLGLEERLDEALSLRSAVSEGVKEWLGDGGEGV